MSAEAAFSVTAKGPGQELVTLRGDTWDEFVANANAAGVDGASYYAAAFRQSGAPAPTTEQAVQNVVNTFPGAAPVAPLPQPGAPAPAPVAGPGGSCAHGARVWKDTAGKGGQQWKRWECSIPWRPNADNTQRCKPVNVV